MKVLTLFLCLTFDYIILHDRIEIPVAFYIYTYGLYVHQIPILLHQIVLYIYIYDIAGSIVDKF